jgi:chromosome segregation ATPase
MWKSNISRGWFGAVRRVAPVVVIVLILTACGDPTQSEEYTSLQLENAALQLQLDSALGERDEIVVRVTGTETALADSVQAVAEAEASLAQGEATIADLRAVVEEMDAIMANRSSQPASSDLIVVQ